MEPGASRRDTVELLEDQAETRLQQLVPIRYGRMLVSPFTFYRGAAAIMAADLANEPRTGLDVQLCGDAHLSNFGVFAAPDRRMVFSINDFDETLPGPFEWDVKRLVASFAVAGRHRGFDDKQRHAINLAVTRAYRDAMAGFAGMRTMELWYTRLDIEDIAARWASHGKGKERKRFEHNVAKARAKDSLRALGKLTHLVDGEPRIASDPPLIVPIEDTVAPGERAQAEAFMHGIIRSYRRTLSRDRRSLLERFRYVHAARKVVGVGSVGTRAWIVLLLGRDDERPAVPAGQGGGGVGARAVPRRQRLRQPRPARRRGPAADAGRERHHARLAEPSTDPLGVKRDFYIRQLWDAKGSALVEAMEPRAMRVYADLCGWTLARAHARSGDPVAIASYLGRGDAFDRALATFAEAYADQNERDYDALAGAAASGRIDVETGL